MKLISLYIENFGKFSNFKYDFDDSYNVFFQNNQWGKTTLSVFIKAMLFGLNISAYHSSWFFSVGSYTK